MLWVLPFNRYKNTKKGRTALEQAACKRYLTSCRFPLRSFSRSCRVCRAKLADQAVLHLLSMYRSSSPLRMDLGLRKHSRESRIPLCAVRLSISSLRLPTTLIGEQSGCPYSGRASVGPDRPAGFRPRLALLGASSWAAKSDGRECS